MQSASPATTETYVATDNMFASATEMTNSPMLQEFIRRMQMQRGRHNKARALRARARIAKRKAKRKS